MWGTDTYWFDVAIATSALTLGHLVFGRFGEHLSPWRRFFKAVMGIGIIVGTAVFAGREWSYVLYAVIGVALVVIHGWWLPRNGVNGLTAEPRDRYYELVGVARRLPQSRDDR